MTTITVVLGSIRKVSLGRYVFNYFKQHQPEIEQAANVTFQFADLRELNLPLFDEDLAPMANPNRNLPANQQRWLDLVQTADGLLILTPEYNHALPASLKNAIDYLAFEAKNKPAKIISYSDNSRGGQFGGAALVPILQRLLMFVLPKSVPIGNVDRAFSATGDLIIDEPTKSKYQSRLLAAISELGFYSRLLADHPFKQS